jgi:hypothetical protein
MDEPIKEVQLDANQREAIAGAKSWVDESAAALGLAYLEFQEAEQRFRLAEQNLASRAATTRQSEMQRNQVMAKFAELLELGPGEWVYDGKDKLVRKDNPNAKSS